LNDERLILFEKSEKDRMCSRKAYVSGTRNFRSRTQQITFLHFFEAISGFL